MNAHDEVAWEEVEDAATEIFNVWYIGSELAWAKEAWEHFSKAGLNQASSVLDRTKVNLRLLALGRIYHEFCGYAWDENTDRPIEYMAEYLDIDPVALGVIAGNAGLDQFADIKDEEGLRESALIEASEGLRAEIFDCLKSAYGSDTELYSRMWKTCRSETRWVDDIEEFGAGEEFWVTAGNMSAWQFVENGFNY